MTMARGVGFGMFIMAVACAFAQSPASGEPAKNPEAQAAEPPSLPKLDFQLSWGSWGLSGNQHKFRQYASPPHGFYIRELTYRQSWARGAGDGWANIQSPWQDDYRLAAGLNLNHGTTRIAASDTKSTFFDPSPVVLSPSGRRVMEAAVRQNLTPNVALSFQSRMDQEDLTYEPPRDAVHQKTRTWNIAAEGTLWHGGFVDLSLTDWRTWDRTNLQPDSNSQQWSAAVTHQFSESLYVNGSYAQTLVRQDALARSRITAWTLGAGWDLGDQTSLQINFQNEQLSLPNVESAYDRARSRAQGRIVHRFGPWTAQAGYTRLALDRVNADHTYVDVPKIHTFEGQIAGRLFPSLRVTLRGSRETMEGGARMETSDPRALYWRNRWTAQLKLDASSENLNGYLVAGFHEDRNDVRNVKVHNQSLTFGGSWQAQPQLELYLESSSDMWGGRMADPQSEPFNAYFPDATSFTVGANWAIDERSQASLNYSQVLCDNANPLGLPNGNIRISTLTANYRFKAREGLELGVLFAPWHYSDLAVGNWGYSTALVGLTARAKF